MSLTNEMNDAYHEEDTSENIGLGCAMEYFSESDEVMNMIENVKSVYSITKKSERAFERFKYVLTLYQEQPHLLDPHLDKMLCALIQTVRSENSPMELKHEAFKYLHIIMKVRGYKIVIRHLPHEVSDLEPVLQILENQDSSDTATWQTRFVLVLWLSIIVMIPFHMSRLDSFEPDENINDARKTVMARIFDVCKVYIVRDFFRVTAILVARFLTRSDVKEVYMMTFLDWSHTIFSKKEGEDHSRCGVMAAIASILKHGKREDLLPYASLILKWLTESKYREDQNALVRKYGVKIIQRIGTINLQSGAPAVESNPAINVQFTISQLAVSGLKVNRLDMYGEKYKPFKGVKYITKAGRFQIRM